MGFHRPKKDSELQVFDGWKMLEITQLQYQNISFIYRLQQWTLRSKYYKSPNQLQLQTSKRTQWNASISAHVVVGAAFCRLGQNMQLSSRDDCIPILMSN